MASISVNSSVESLTLTKKQSLSLAKKKSVEKQKTMALAAQEPNPVQEEEDEKEPLVSLQEVYVDMVRNQKLDYENFQEKDVIQKTIEQKNKSTKQVMQFKTKVWKQNYMLHKLLPAPVRNEC